MLRAFGMTDRGRVRPTNEDCFGIDNDLRLCVVADGMGGHNAGEVASRMAVEAVTDYVRTVALHQGEPLWPFGFDSSLSIAGNVLRTAIHIANVQILESTRTAHEWTGMGTTIVATLVRNRSLAVAHVGDSRLYLFARRKLRQVTRDDSWMAAVLAENPTANPLALQHHPLRGALTNVVGARSRTEVHVAEEALYGGELLALTTDGVHDVLDDRRIERLLAEGGYPDEIAPNLISAALARGSQDNCTAVVAQYVAG